MKRVSAIAALLLFCGTAATAGADLRRMSLWRVVHNLCVPINSVTGAVFPCLEVNRAAGFVVLRYPSDPTQVLVVPTARISGIESPVLLQAGMPNYWHQAWNARNYVSEAARRPLGWGDIGMALNRKDARTQDQLHIHVDCLDARIKRRLELHPVSPSSWTLTDLPPVSGRYYAKKFGANGLDRDLFHTIAATIPGGAAEMEAHSIAVLGIKDKSGDGFVVLVGNSGAHAEDLLDHSCAE